MRYIRIVSRSGGVDLDFYIEVDENNRETRKIELAAGGILGFTSTERSFHGTVLAQTPLISDHEITQEPGMKLLHSTNEAFESIWSQVVYAASLIN